MQKKEYLIKFQRTLANWSENDSWKYIQKKIIKHFYGCKSTIITTHFSPLLHITLLGKKFIQNKIENLLITFRARSLCSNMSPYCASL
jgi:hypothetical protein